MSSESPETCETGVVHGETTVFTNTGLEAHIVGDAGCIIPRGLVEALVLIFPILILRLSELRLVDALDRRKIREDVQERGPESGWCGDDGVYERLELWVGMEKEDKRKGRVGALELHPSKHGVVAAGAQLATCER